LLGFIDFENEVDLLLQARDWFLARTHLLAERRGIEVERLFRKIEFGHRFHQFDKAVTPALAMVLR
jgi:hypothetical protein